MTYAFRTELDYHGMATWVASRADPNPYQDWNISTFKVERKLYQTLFVELWGRLNEAQRRELLVKIDPAGSTKDLVGKAAATGSAALATLSAGVAISGFAFYTAMSTTIAAVAATVGGTVPFAAYATASTVVGVLSGPVGWAVMGLAGLGGLALLGRANVALTTAYVCRIHALKVEALVAAGIPAELVFENEKLSR